MSGIGQSTSSASAWDEPLELLAMALRARPATVTELAAISRGAPTELRDHLIRLAELDLIAFDGDNIGYRPPSQTITALSTSMLGDAARELNTRLADTSALLAALPSLVTSAAVSAAENADFGGEIFHGPTAAHELWHSIAVQQHERRSACMFPDAAPLFVPNTPQSDTWRASLRTGEFQVRAILSTEDVASPESRPLLKVAEASGVEFRAMRQPPSWFWLTQDAVGLPLRWGDSWPTTAIALRNEAVVSLMHGLFDTWWQQAAPLHSATHPWDAMVTLMADGATLEAAAHALGISARTGRRRIEAAVDHYRVVGAVALGAAWQRERSLREHAAAE